MSDTFIQTIYNYLKPQQFIALQKTILSVVQYIEKCFHDYKVSTNKYYIHAIYNRIIKLLS